MPGIEDILIYSISSVTNFPASSSTRDIIHIHILEIILEIILVTIEIMLIILVVSG